MRQYIKTAIERADLHPHLNAAIKIAIVYIDQSGSLIIQADGENAAIETFRAAVVGIVVPKPAPPISPVQFMLLFPAAVRVQLRASNDPLIIDLLRLIDDQRLLQIDRNLPSVIEAIDYVGSATSMTEEQIAVVKGVG
jgi:hypothetical protein